MADQYWDDPNYWDDAIYWDGPDTGGGTSGALFNAVKATIAADTSAPTSVAILSPDPNSEVNGTLDLVLSAHDNRDPWVEEVLVYMDGIFIGQALPMQQADRYKLTWDTTQSYIGDGSHVLTAAAIDNANNVAYSASSVTIRVNNLLVPPLYPFSITQILDVADGIGVIPATVQWEVWQKGTSPAGLLSPYEDSGTSPTINHATQQTTFRTISNFMITASDLAALDTNTDEIQAWYVMPNGERLPLGRFLFSQNRFQRRSYGGPSNVDFFDRTWKLDQKLERSVGLAPGDRIVDLYRQLAQEVGILDIEIDADAATATVGASTAWPPGTSRADVCKALSAMLAAYPPHFGNLGALRVRVVPDLLSAAYDQHYNMGGTIIDGTITETDASYSAPNRYIVVGSGQTPVVGYFDVPADAPHSYARIGYYVTESFNLNVESAAAAEAAAIAAYAKDVRTFRTVTFQSTPNPRHVSFDFLEYLGDPHLETQWSLPCSPGGAMSHTASRIWTGGSAVG